MGIPKECKGSATPVFCTSIEASPIEKLAELMPTPPLLPAALLSLFAPAPPTEKEPFVDKDAETCPTLFSSTEETPPEIFHWSCNE